MQIVAKGLHGGRSLAVDVGAIICATNVLFGIWRYRMACWATAVIRLVNNDLDSLQKFLKEEKTGTQVDENGCRTLGDDQLKAIEAW